MRGCSLRWANLAAAIGLLCLPAAMAQPQVVITFEPPYAIGELGGQDGWSVVSGGVAAEANVVNSDNGPSLPGAQCVELTNVSGEVRLRRNFVADLVTTYGPYIEFQYDVKYVTNGVNKIVQARSRLYDAQKSYAGIGQTHFNGGGGAGCQVWCSPWPDCSQADWGPGDPVWTDQEWHTVKWVLFYQPTIPSGMFAKLVFDGMDQDRAGWYFANWGADASGIADSVDWLELRMTQRTAPYFDEVFRFDNYQIAASPAPGAVPVADTSATATSCIASDWDTPADVTLDGSASTDDGTIVRYVWRRGTTIVGDTSSPQWVVPLGAGVYDLNLSVVDDTGLFNTTTVRVSVRGPAFKDNPQIAGSMLFADSAGTSVYAGVPVLVSETQHFTILNQIEFGPWDYGDPTGPFFNFCFDADGNLYYAHWSADWGLVSFDKDLNWRFYGTMDGNPANKVALGGVGNNCVIVGERFVYAAGRDPADGNAPIVCAFHRSDGILAWKTKLVRFSDNNAIEPQEFRPRMTLYDNFLYVTGTPDAEYPDQCRIYLVNSESGAQIGASLVTVELQGNGQNYFGNLVVVPDAFGPGLHGLYWSQRSAAAPDGRCDTVGIQVDPTTGTAATAWGPVSGINGPSLTNSHILYSAARNRLYSHSDTYNGFSSLYVWDPGAAGGAQLLASVVGGNHGYGYDWQGPVAAIDDFTAGVTRIHVEGGTTSQTSEIWTYTDDGVNPITAEVRSFPSFGSNEYKVAGALAQDSLGRSVMYAPTLSPSWLTPRPSSYLFALNLSSPAPLGQVLGKFRIWYDNATYPYYEDAFVIGLGPDGTMYYMQGGRDYMRRITRLGAAADPVGPCCLAYGYCLDLLWSACLAAGGQWQDAGGASCDRLSPCPLPQACCFDDGSCQDIAPWACAVTSGTPMGEGSTCRAGLCNGACCLLDGACIDVSPQVCAAAGGDLQGRDTQCPFTACPQPGACCTPTGCLETLPGICTGAGGYFFGEATTCANSPQCPPNDACGSAIAVAVPGSVAGDITYATLLDPVPPGCCDADGTVDVWYIVIGNGRQIRATLCNSAIVWDSQIAVYEGTCPNLGACVSCADDTCPPPPDYGKHGNVTWQSVQGQLYTIRVFGWDYQVHQFGPFQLDIETVVPPTGACCVRSWCVADQAEAGCVAMGGIYQGGGSTCAPAWPCPVCYADANCDNQVNFDDINYFVAALAGGSSGWASYYASQNGGSPPPCSYTSNDANRSGVANFDDINPFVELLVNPVICP